MIVERTFDVQYLFNGFMSRWGLEFYKKERLVVVFLNLILGMNVYKYE